MDNDRIGGIGHRLQGIAKRGFGKMIGDAKLTDDGAAERARGEAQVASAPGNGEVMGIDADRVKGGRVIGPARRPTATAPPRSTQPTVAATPKASSDLQTLPMDKVEQQLGSSPDGLSQTEALRRLASYGPNEIEERKANALLKFLSYF